VSAPRWASAAALAAVLVAAGWVLPLAHSTAGAPLRWDDSTLASGFLALGLAAAVWAAWRPPRSAPAVTVFTLACLGAATAPLATLARGAAQDVASWQAGFWCDIAALALLGVTSLRCMAALDAAAPTAGPAWTARLAALGARSGTPLLFGTWVLVFWQLLTQALDVPRVLLPAPSVVWDAWRLGAGVLASDFAQTVLHSVLIGWLAGCTLGFVVGVAIDRSTFLQRGLLPLAAMASTVPLVGVAPIMVMWFGFDWQSKAAVVVVMTFFPMLVNTLAGLAESGHMERDLMRSYGASYWRTLASLRIPVALPFVFNALKINSTLAMIGAIVAEFFGSPTAGLGFRISTEAARLNMGLVWAAIGVAAVSGSLLYGALGWVERRVTFWHPSVRTLS